MLLAVEGGGFFSSSASGYSKGLTLLLFGRKNEERPMRVLPWNHYQLVEQEVLETKTQLASRKKQTISRRIFLVCFGRISAGEDEPSHPKETTVQELKSFPNSISASVTDKTVSNDVIYENIRETSLKSNLKKLPANDSGKTFAVVDDAHGSVKQDQSNTPCSSERRKVQWTDAFGRELTQIREFEASEKGASDDEYEHKGRCGCVIQ